MIYGKWKTTSGRGIFAVPPIQYDGSQTGTHKQAHMLRAAGRQTRSQEPIMTQPERPTTAPLSPLAYSVGALWSGFDYAFGYQLKLLSAFWGLSRDRR